MSYYVTWIYVGIVEILFINFFIVNYIKKRNNKQVKTE